MALEAGSLVVWESFLEAHHRACSLEPFSDHRSTKFLILTFPEAEEFCNGKVPRDKHWKDPGMSST